MKMPTVAVWGLIAVMMAVIIEVKWRLRGKFSENAAEWFRNIYIAGCVFFVMMAWETFWTALNAIIEDRIAIVLLIGSLVMGFVVSSLFNRKNF